MGSFPYEPVWLPDRGTLDRFRKSVRATPIFAVLPTDLIFIETIAQLSGNYIVVRRWCEAST